MRTILVPTDFSANAYTAGRYAVQLAKLLQARIVLFHAATLYIPVAEVPQPAQDMRWIEKQSRLALRKQGKKLAKVLPGQISVATTTTLNSAAHEILRMAKKVKADLIVMGTRGSHSNLLEQIFGTVATGVLRQTRIPALVIPEKYRYTPVQKIVVGCDKAETFSTPVVKGIKELTELFQAEAVLLKILNLAEFYLHGAIVHNKAEIDEKLVNVKHSYAFGIDEDAVEGIDSFAVKEKADMVVLLPKKHNLLKRFFEGTHTKRLALRTHKPFLIFPVDITVKRAAKAFRQEKGTNVA